jgi:hypothetical protein
MTAVSSPRRATIATTTAIIDFFNRPGAVAPGRFVDKTTDSHRHDGLMLPGTGRLGWFGCPTKAATVAGANLLPLLI